MRRLTLKTPAGNMEYTLARRPRVTRRLHMELDDRGGLVVVAPRHWSVSDIDATLSQNTTRIERFLIRARGRQQEPLRFVGGERHFYLGERYPLVIDARPGGKAGVVFNGAELRVRTDRESPDHIFRIMQGWYRQRAKEVLAERMRLVASRAGWLADGKVPFKLRRMKRTWGNCSSRGVIKLNTHLIKAPFRIIDSVIAHELCHLREMNHGRAFYALLENLNPGWREDRARLLSEGNRYLL